MTTEFPKIHQTGSFELARPPAETIRLFTAPGETLWVPGWEPRILSGNGTERGTVFLTGEGEGTAIWIVLEYDTSVHRARYAKVTPRLHAGTVDVALQKNEAGGTIATITYELTALSDAGSEALQAFDDAPYSKMMKEWKALIEQAAIDYEALAAE